MTPLLATPPTVTTTGPVVEFAGTGTVMEVSFQLVGLPAVPLNVTVLVPCGYPNPLPLIVTELPIGPVVGERLVMVGPAASTEQAEESMIERAKMVVRRRIHRDSLRL